jgi:hypothetical protein
VVVRDWHASPLRRVQVVHPLGCEFATERSEALLHSVGPTFTRLEHEGPSAPRHERNADVQRDSIDETDPSDLPQLRFALSWPSLQMLFLLECGFHAVFPYLLWRGVTTTERAPWVHGQCRRRWCCRIG